MALRERLGQQLRQAEGIAGTAGRRRHTRNGGGAPLQSRRSSARAPGTECSQDFARWESLKAELTARSEEVEIRRQRSWPRRRARSAQRRSDERAPDAYQRLVDHFQSPRPAPEITGLRPSVLRLRELTDCAIFVSSPGGLDSLLPPWPWLRRGLPATLLTLRPPSATPWASGSSR